MALRLKLRLVFLARDAGNRQTCGPAADRRAQGSYFFGAVYAEFRSFVCTGSWSILLPSSLRGPPVASHLNEAGPIPRVGLGRAAVSVFYRNRENLELWNVHRLPQRRGQHLSGGLHCQNP